MSKKPHFIGATARLPKSVCLNCGAACEAATAVDDKGATPQPGSITVCLYCGHLMAFSEELTLRALTDEEMHDIAGDDRILAVQRVRGQVMKEAADDIDFVVCPTVAQMPIPTVPSTTATCSKCSANIWVANSSPRIARRICIRCAAIEAER